MYWYTYAIKEWLKQWFKQNLVEAWTIDNYDGQESYEELNFERNKRHVEEFPVAPRMFHQMRATMQVIQV